MQYYKIEIIINKDGTITEKVLASGTECTAVTEELEKALGEVVSQRPLPESQELYGFPEAKITVNGEIGNSTSAF